MDQFSKLRNELCLNLKLLSFENFMTKTNQKFELKADLFKNWTQAVFQSITYFLFSMLNSEESRNRFRACFPVLDKRQESEFRQITYKWLQEITERETDCHFPRVVAFHFQNLSGETFCHLYLEFSNYVMTKVIERTASQESIECPLIGSNDLASYNSQTKYHFNQYNKVKNEIEQQTHKWTEQIKYFIDAEHELLESIKLFDQKRAHLFKTISAKFSADINSNEDTLVDHLNELQIYVQQLKNTLNCFNDNVSKNWQIYLSAFESETNSSLDCSIDLNDSLWKPTKDIDSFDSVIDNLVSRIQAYEQTVQNVESNDLATSSQISTKLLTEARSYRKQLIDVLSKFEYFFNQSKDLVDKKRCQLLANPLIIERRKWFEERIADITKLNFKLEPKKKESMTKELVNIVSDKDSKENESYVESPKIVCRRSFGDYSYKVMDFSTCGYIAPSGSMDDDEQLFSPIERTQSD